MSIALPRHDSHRQQRQAEQAELLDKTAFGFWVYLMTDLVLFASLFAVYAVMHTATAGGPALGRLFDMPDVLAETLVLLTSSFSCGLALLGAHATRGRKRLLVAGSLALTLLLGAVFLSLELREFSGLVADGYSWRASGALSAFFVLVATHGAHITAGLIWIAVMIARVLRQGVTANNLRRLTIFSLFWHFLDIVWIFIFTFVYLMGAAS